MPLNRNAHVLDLLSWHGHDKGGVRVPFGKFGEPLGRVIETTLRGKLVDAASRIAGGEPSPRWILLVGGPGNGKSQMVEEFVRVLGEGLKCRDELVDIVASSFRRTPIPRKVEVSAAIYGSRLGAAFSHRVGNLIIIQDASASDDSSKDAAEALAEDLLRLLTDPRQPNEPIPVLLCCANRGLLARTLMAAVDIGTEVVDLMEAVIRASGLGEEALQKDRPKCWPVEAPTFAKSFPELSDAIACWPLDMESLLLGYDKMQTAAETIFAEAVDPRRWEAKGCDECTSKPRCPFFQNASWLRDKARRGALMRVIRREELAIGQKWNFRSLFSLTAELVVGEWEDFGGASGASNHPCDWVHTSLTDVDASDPNVSIPAAFRLALRLYPHALFVGTLPVPGLTVTEITASLPAAAVVTRFAATRGVTEAKPIRRTLYSDIVPSVDLARWSPEDDRDLLADLEDSYSQSVALGNERWPSEGPPTAVEGSLFAWLRMAEEECDPLLMGRDSAKAYLAVRFLRQVAATLAKRSVGVRLGKHANERYLGAYEATIRDLDLLGELQSLLRDLLSGAKFRFNALASFGQPQADNGSLVVLESDSMPIRPITPAPSPTAELPAHDFPAISVAGHPVPLTFDLFTALQLKRDGCSSGSLPASVRASLDRIRQLHAGQICRAEVEFLERNAHFDIDQKGSIVVTSEGSVPRFTGAHAG
jgi:hypothetical protein